MPRQPRFPSYPTRPHKSGQARVRISGQDVYLGVWNSPASWAEYQRLLDRWRQALAAGVPLVPDCPVDTVAELVARFVVHARAKYAHDPRELKWYEYAVEPLTRHFGNTDLRDFGPKKLREVLRLYVVEKHWCRNVCNHNRTRLLTLFRWAESEELVPRGTAENLRTVPGLRVGEHGVEETPEVVPVPEADLEKTLPCLGPVVREVVDLLLLSGARPSELLRLRPCDLDRSGSVEIARGYRVQLGNVWAVQPQKHKTAFRGHRRVILFGPQAQRLLAPFLSRPPDVFLFSPAEAVARFRELQRAARRSKVQPSQRDRSKPRPQRQPRDRYDAGALHHAVRRACLRAGVEPWTPYQLRHNAATRLVQEFGWDVARIVLGQRSVDVTRGYAVDDLEKAAAAMQKVG